MPTNYCPNCGAELKFKEAEICPTCGVRIKEPPPQKEVKEVKSPGIAAILSFFITGLGQIYNGQIVKGLVFLVLAIVFVFLSAILIGIPFLIFIWIYGIYDAYNTAKKINMGQITA